MLNNLPEMLKKNKFLYVLILLISCALFSSLYISNLFEESIIKLKNNDTFYLEKGIYNVFCLEEDYNIIENFNDNFKISEDTIILNFERKTKIDFISSKNSLTINELKLVQINTLRIEKNNNLEFILKGINTKSPIFIQNYKFEKYLIYSGITIYVSVFILIIYILFKILNSIIKSFI